MNWHEIRNPQDSELDRLAGEFSIHPLHVEDCRLRDQRAKIEEGASYLFVVVKTLRVTEEKELEFSDFDIFLGNDWVITVQEGNQDCVEGILGPIRSHYGQGRGDQLFYRIIDGVIDSYLPVLDKVDDVIDQLEEGAMQDATPAFLAHLFSTKRNLIDFRRVLVNTRDVTAHLYRVEHQLIAPDLIPFFRDVFDHVARNLDFVETQRDLVTETMNVYLTNVANRTNQVMKVLTVLGTIALPVIVISGYFGMNTKNLPLTESPYGTVIVSAMMVVVTVLLLGVLRMFKWF